MSTNFFDFLSALEQRLDAAALGVPLKHPGEPYEPAPGTPWARAAHLPVVPVQASVGSGGTHQFLGTLQVDLFYPRGQGGGAAVQQADKLATAFAPGTSLSANGKQVRITTVEQGAPREDQADPQWLQLPVLIHWYCITQP